MEIGKQIMYKEEVREGRTTFIKGRMTILKRQNNNKKNPRSSSSSSQTWSRNVKRRILGEEEEDDNCFMPATTILDDDNILSEILTRVPAKTLGGLKVINKRWYSLISDPFFINKHTTRSLQTIPYDAFNFFTKGPHGNIIHLSIDRSSPHLISTTIFSLGREHSAQVIRASCHGLLLTGLLRIISNRITCRSMCIVNPLTKKKRFIPSPYRRKHCEFGLVPTSFSSSLDYHYSVVCLVSTNTGFEFKIFIPKKGRWRDFNKSTRISFGNGFKKDDKPIDHSPVWFRGIIHWLSSAGYIIAFNLDKEESRLIEIPKSVFEMVKRVCWWSRAWLGVVKDKLNLVVVTLDDEILTWVLNDYENSKWDSKRKYAIKMKKNPGFYIQPVFFDGDRFFLNVKSSVCAWINSWHEYDVQTGVLSSLLPQAPQNSFLGISTLAEV